MKNTLKAFLFLLACWLSWPLTTHAQTTATASKPLPADLAAAPEFKVAPAQTTYPMLRLTPDKPEIIHLDRDARSVLVGNPAHLNVILDNTKTLVLVPRDPGATYFTVIDHDGKIVMERYVIVAGPAQKYIRIRRTCPAGITTGCVATSVYYCPDLCYDTGVMSSTLGQPGPAPALPASGAPADAAPTSVPVPAPAVTTTPAAAPSPVH